MKVVSRSLPAGPSPPGRITLIACSCALSAAVAYPILASGSSSAWNVSLLVLALTALSRRAGLLRLDSYASLQRLALYAAMLFPAYVAFQLIPLPLWALAVLSPRQAEIVSALGGVMAAPRVAALSISPPVTWAYLSRVAGCALVFLLARYLARAHRQNPWIAVAPLLVIAGAEAMLGIVQRLAGDEVAGTYANRNHFANLLAMVLPFAIAAPLAVVIQRARTRSLSAAAAVGACGLLALALVLFLAVGFSLSRMGTLSMLASLMAMSVVAISRLAGWRRWSALGAVALGVVLLLAYLSPAELIRRFDIVASGEPTEGRIPIWRDAVRLAGAYPLFGSGLGTFYPGLLPYQTWAVDLTWTTAHNDYLQLLAELGAVGLLVPAALILALGVHAIRVARSDSNVDTRLFGLACWGGLSALLIHSLAEFNLYIAGNAMVVSWIAGLITGVPHTPARRPRDPDRRGSGAAIRRYALGFAALAAMYAGASLVFERVYAHDSRAERLFCRVGICDTRRALSALQWLYGDTAAASVPPSLLMEFVRRDPASPYPWCDLGEAFLKAGRTEDARYSFARALALAPRIPSVLSRAGHFHLELGDYSAALKLMAVALEGDPTYAPSIFAAYDRRRVPLEEVLHHGLPDQPHVGQAYVRHRIQKLTGDAADTHNASSPDMTELNTIWLSTIRRGHADDQLAGEYTRFLLAHRLPYEAWQAWMAYARTRHEGYPANHVFNASFERELTGVAFDWNIHREGHDVEAMLDPAVGRSGSRSLRLRFSGKTNVRYEDTSQNIVLSAGLYRFQAFLRSDGLTTDEGVRFRIADPAGRIVAIETDAIVGTRDWTPIQQMVRVPEPTLVVVRVVRRPSLRFDSRIAGTVWIDDVALTKVTSGRDGRPTR